MFGTKSTLLAPVVIAPPEAVIRPVFVPCLSSDPTPNEVVVDAIETFNLFEYATTGFSFLIFCNCNPLLGKRTVDGVLVVNCALLSLNLRSSN